MNQPAKDTENSVKINEIKALGHALRYLATRLDQIGVLMEQNGVGELPRMGQTTAPRGQEMMSSYVSRLQKRLDDILSSPANEPTEWTPDALERFAVSFRASLGKTVSDQALIEKMVNTAIRELQRVSAESSLQWKERMKRIDSPAVESSANKSADESKSGDAEDLSEEIEAVSRGESVTMGFIQDPKSGKTTKVGGGSAEKKKKPRS